MNSREILNVKATKSFARNLKYIAKKHRGIEYVVFAKALMLAENPEMGVLIPGTNNTLRKIRLSDPVSGKGKRGGFRLIYAWRDDFDSVFLCMIYPKSEKADATSDDVEKALKEIESILSD